MNFLQQKLARLQQELEAKPHRPVKTGSANAQERRHTCQQVSTLYEEPEHWQDSLRAIAGSITPRTKSSRGSVWSRTNLISLLRTYSQAAGDWKSCAWMLGKIVSPQVRKTNSAHSPKSSPALRMIRIQQSPMSGMRAKSWCCAY